MQQIKEMLKKLERRTWRLPSKGMGLISAFTFLILISCSWWAWWAVNGIEAGAPGQSPGFKKVVSIKAPDEEYDVIVIGTDPEGIAAAVSAARNGQKTLLVEARDRDVLGGLFTIGWLNSLDNSFAPNEDGQANPDKFLNEGIFQEWREGVEGTSFDIRTAANKFYELVRKEKKIDLLMHASALEPTVTDSANSNSEAKTVTGLTITTADGKIHKVKARTVIDATQDADVAAAAGVPFTFGRGDLGDEKSLMAVTLVFSLKGMTDDIWQQMIKKGAGDPNLSKGMGADAMSGWGYSDMWNYESTNPDRVRMRGLNIGRQKDGTILINALQIFGVDPLNPESVKQGIEIGKTEIPHVVAHMKKHYPELAPLELGSIAPELYVRESRHMIGEYRLTMTDLLDNRDHWDKIGYGSYNADIQSTNAKYRGTIIMKPAQYAIPFRTLVPQKVDGILVVGRSASFDTLPHGSARTVPVGMAAGQAAGAAAAIASERKVTFRDMTNSKPLVTELQDKLTKQGVRLQPYPFGAPAYTKHKAYEGLKTAVSLGIASGHETNDFALDKPSNPKQLVNAINTMRTVISKAYPKALTAGADVTIKGLTKPDEIGLTWEQAAWTISQAVGAKVKRNEAATYVLDQKIVNGTTYEQITDKAKLTYGEIYLLLRDVLKAQAGVVYN
ncbi:FAD-dependent oxidoreductase [Paenibacillus lutrae]|uniref:FAD-dependent oxidoreductase n=1 Tax=Paenibacillus lutrae TaxID=2078573 RepID=A0A7X3FMR9_9BACL|nr:FAD-dependent oxidoreductase [Paenibacillus lutrae]MVP02578.1 FAD-dependent oxidoreductase [Paenibacillus lutrae]